jgi:hypothetical protein
MDPAIVVPIVPLLPSAASALLGPFIVAAAVAVGGVATVVALVLRDSPARPSARQIVLDVVAHPVVEGRSARPGGPR